MQSLKTAVFFMFVIVVVSLIGVLSTGCSTVPTATRDDSLEQSRIIAAVNAERNRWTEELSQQLRDGLVQVEKRINTVEGGLQQVAAAAREYREFVLRIIEQLSTVTGPISGSSQLDGAANSNTGDMDRVENTTGDNRIQVPNP